MTDFVNWHAMLWAGQSPEGPALRVSDSQLVWPGRPSPLEAVCNVVLDSPGLDWRAYRVNRDKRLPSFDAVPADEAWWELLLQDEREEPLEPVRVEGPAAWFHIVRAGCHNRLPVRPLWIATKRKTKVKATKGRWPPTPEAWFRVNWMDEEPP